MNRIKNLTILSVIVSILMIATFSTTSLAANNRAQAVSRGSDDMDGVWAASRVYSAYSGNGFDAYRLSDPSAVTFLSLTVVNPKVFFMISQYANSQQIVFNRTGLKTGSDTYWGKEQDLYGVQRTSWENSRLVMLVGPETAKGNNNITQQIYGQMTPVGAAIGWETQIANISACDWSVYFNRKMAQGDNVTNAKYHANSYTYADNRIKTPKIYGNVLATVNDRTNRAENLNAIVISGFETDNRKHVINYNVDYNDESGFDNINNMLAREFEGFNSSKYEVSVNGDLEEQIIDCTLKIGKFSTLSGYTIFVKNGKVTEVYDNTIKPSTQKAKDNLKSIDVIKEISGMKSEEEYKKMSCEKLLKSIEGATNIEQTTKFFYNIETGKKYIVVNTMNVTDDFNNIHSDYYEIS